MARSSTLPKVFSFDLEPGAVLAGKYRVLERLGKGWEGEVYLVRERSTGIERSAKIFFPRRNRGNRAVRFYAKKLHKLRDCRILIQYHTQETVDPSHRRVTRRWPAADPALLAGDATLDGLPIDHSVAAVDIPGGTAAAAAGDGLVALDFATPEKSAAQVAKLATISGVKAIGFHHQLQAVE